MIPEKKCRECGVSKYRFEFSKRTASPDGIDVICRACKRTYKEASRRRAGGKQCGEIQYPALALGSTWSYVTSDGAERSIRIVRFRWYPGGLRAEGDGGREEQVIASWLAAHGARVDA